MMLPIKYIAIHHSATPQDWTMAKTIKAIDDSHKRKLHRYKNSLGYHIAYHYIIDKDGKEKQTRSENEIGYHCGNWYANQQSLAIMLIGNFDKEEPTQKQIETLANLVDRLKRKYAIKPEDIQGHRKFRATACPGGNLTDKEIQAIAEGELLTSKFKPSDWAKEAWEEAVEDEFVKKESNPHGFLTRQEYFVIRRREKMKEKIKLPKI
jgi:hypothetical protein